MSRRETGLVLAIAIVFVGGCAGSAPGVVSSTAMLDLDVIFVATDLDVVYAMLEAAKVGPGDVVYDLGCGDGRIVVAAASRYGARGVGVDLDRERIREANENAARARVTDRVTFLQRERWRKLSRANRRAPAYLRKQRASPGPEPASYTLGSDEEAAIVESVR